MKDMDMGLIRMSVDHVNGVAIGNFSNASRNEAIRDKFREILGMEDGRFDDMAWERGKLECFAYLREVYKQTIANGDGAMSEFYNRFVNEKHLEWGDKLELEIENDAYLTVGKISGNNWDLDRQRMDKGAKIAISTDSYYVKIYEYFKRFLTGRMDFSELFEKVNVSIKKFKDDFVADVFAKGVEGLPQSWFYVGSYDETEIQKVLNNVTASNDGSDIVLTGTKGALNRLQGIQVVNLSDSQKAEYNTNGYLREWKGYTCVELPTLFKSNSITEFVFDTETVYALPMNAKPVTIVTEGDPLVKEINEISDKKDMTKEFATIFNIGGAFVMNRLIGGFKITA